MVKPETRAAHRKAKNVADGTPVVIYAQTNLGISEEQTHALLGGKLIASPMDVWIKDKGQRAFHVKPSSNFSMGQIGQSHTPVELSQIGWNEKRARQFVRDIESIADAPSSLRSKLVDLIIRGIAGSHLMVAKQHLKTVALTEVIDNLVTAQPDSLAAAHNTINQTLDRVEAVIAGFGQTQPQRTKRDPWAGSMSELSKPEAIAAAQEVGDPETNVRAYAREAGRQLEAWAGELLGATVIRDRFNISPQMLSQYRKKGHIVAFPNGRTKFRYPAEQFRERAILPDVEPVLKLAGSPFSAWHWLVHMAPPLGHKRPIDLLWTGENEAVIEAAELQFGQ
jgi:hypothetical protein